MTLNTEKVSLSPLIEQRIKALHQDKMAINNHKIAVKGSLNIDDHGYIVYENFRFQHIPGHESGMVHGCRNLGQNLRKFLNEIPAYVNKNSALATCWIGFFQDFAPIGLVPEDRPPEHIRELLQKYGIIQSGIGGMNHLCPDMTIGFELGWGGLLQKIRYYREFNAPADTSFYDGEEELVLGIQEWIRRHVTLARSMAEEESDETAKQNLLEIARINEWLIDNPPRTLREACQFLAHFQGIDRTYFGGGAMGQLDELLRPFYERDTADGILTDEEAVWYIASLFFNDTHYSQIGGPTPDGSHDMTSRMSFLILEAMHDLCIPANIAIRVHDGINEVLLRRALEYTVEDGFGCSYSMAQGIEEGFAKNGFPKELGRIRAKTGCNWTAIPGREYPLQDVTRCNFARALNWAIEDLKQEESPTVGRLWELFKKHLHIMVNCFKEGYDWHYEVVSRNTPEIVDNLFMHGPIERGLNCAQGGVDIMDLNIDGIGLATVADSFAAIEQRVVKEKRLSWEELFRVLETNYEGAEDIRLMLKNISRFGTPDSPAEKWALKIRDTYVSFCKESLTPKHHLMIVPGMFSHGDVYMYGNVTMATPNGRKDKDPISHSSEPDPGFARGLHTFAPSLKANAVAKTQAGYGNSAPLHLDIDTDLLSHGGGVDALVALLHTHNHMNGTLVNLNCLTKQKLLEAHADPSTHPDLVVRVTGYSAFFASLSKEYRQQVVDRFLANDPG